MTRRTPLPLLVVALLTLGGAPLHAQRSVQLEVVPPSPSTRSAIVTTTNLFGDADMRDLVRSGFPASMHFRLELWRMGGLFNDLERQEEWEIIIQYEPSSQQYRVGRRRGDRLEDVGSFGSLASAQMMLQRPVKVTLLPSHAGARYYYNLVLNVEALSVSDMDQVERWLRGVREDGAAASLGNGMRTLMLRMLGGEKRSYQKRSPSFVAAQ